MAPTSIDGTEITGATIDGQDVSEITVDGETVFTAVFTEDFEDNNVQFDNIPEFTGYSGPNSPSITTNSISGNYSLECDMNTDFRVEANFDFQPSKVVYTQFKTYSSDGFGDSTAERIQDGNGNTIASVDYGVPHNNNYVEIMNQRDFTGYGTLTAQVTMDLDWENSSATVTVDGVGTRSGSLGTVDVGSGMKFVMRADADRWDFLRRYDNFEFYP